MITESLQVSEIRKLPSKRDLVYSYVLKCMLYACLFLGAGEAYSMSE